MMNNILYRHLILPEELCLLLRTELFQPQPMTFVIQRIQKNKALYIRLTRYFSSLDDGRGFEKVAQGLGWPSFRNYLMNFYLDQLKTGHSFQDISLSTDSMSQVLDLEKQFGQFELSGTSRIVLLGFYLENLRLSSRQENEQPVSYSVPDELTVLLRLTQFKSEKVDFLIIILMHFMKFLGYEKLLAFIGKGDSFDLLYPKLSENERRELFHHLLSYATSIYEPEFIYQRF